jgi:hypothetical protein
MPFRRVAVAGFAFISAIVSAQEAAPPSSPPSADSNAPPVSVILKRKDDKPLHFGEKIELEVQYVALQPGYVRVQGAHKLAGYDSWKMECQPAEQIIDRRRSNGQVSAEPFYYGKLGCPTGTGGSRAIGCSDCGGEMMLGREPTSFPVTLNYDFQFLQPGRYVCTEHTADVTIQRKSPNEERAAIPISSYPLTLDVKDDPTWSAETLTKTLQELETTKCNNAPDNGMHCTELITTIRYLDTEDSLRALVKLYPGTFDRNWPDHIWFGILQSRHAQLRLDLLEKRMQDADFAVTTPFLDTLVALAIQRDTPEAFDDDTPAKDGSPYYAASLSLLLGYLKLVGDSLPNKQGEARRVSLETYKGYASQLFCEDDPLIAPAEMQRVLGGANATP